MTFETDIKTLSSAEDFLDYFDLTYDAQVVHVNRLHILKRFHDYLAEVSDLESLNAEEMEATYRTLLERAYMDFTTSDSLTEKVFKVFKEAGKPAGFVPLESVGR